jgi:DNA-directed RNA polymerase specialized sigma24 family protein
LESITGNPAADAKLRAQIHYTLAANGVRPDDIEDCSQDVMLALLTVPGVVRDLIAYACGIARHMATQQFRRLVRQRAFGDICAALGITPTQFRLEKTRGKAQFLERVARVQAPLREAA